ncbi:MAG: hypothetical protein IT337_07660 [Thermomicrobiales bacterium]|nr:hypothetical protein [Thermomicrobiales bacterium]
MSVSLNGTGASEDQRGLRWVWFGGSIISDWNNPVATTNRAVIRALQQRGHRVVFIEPSDNPAFMEALRERGSAIYRAFQADYPDIHYRRETLPAGSEGDVWLSRETALADVLVVQDDAPDRIFDWLERLPDVPIVRLLLSSSESPAARAAPFDAVLSSVATGEEIMYGPAVLRDTGADSSPRSGALTVVYAGTGADAAEGEVIAAGAGAPAALPFVAETQLPRRYRALERVTIVDDDPSPFAAARPMLAVAGGATVAIARSGGEPQPFALWNDAGQQAERLIRQVRTARARRPHVQE